MDLSKIISVAGKQGLFRIVAQGRQALIVESLIDGKRTPVHASVRVSSLEEISMFTTGDDVPLTDVLKKLHAVEKGGPSLDPKEDTDKLFAKLGEALPEHDRERIYPSDVRKFFAWYEQLLKSGLLNEPDAPAGEEKAAEEEGTKAKKTSSKEEGAKKPKVKAGDAKAPKAGAASKPKATTMRKSAQRGS
jgi:hypothetical protein